MDPGELTLLTLAGVGAGLTGSIAGLASLVSYPALVAAGLPPVTANVTNTVALVFHGIGAAYGSRPELAGQGARLRRLAILAILGGAVGGGLLLLTPSAMFERIVPWLIGLSSLAVLRRPKALGEGHHHDGTRSWWVRAGVFLVAVYGGYFGAAAGVMLLALLLTVTSESLARSSAARTVLLSSANAVAALAFVLFGPVDWAAAAPLAVGFLAGGRVGPILVRHAPADLLRLLIAAIGIAVAVQLGLKAYS